MIDAHREHRAFLDHDALDHFGAGADEAIVLDDHRPGLQRLQHAADAGAAGDVAVLADLGAGADRGPGIDHGAAVDPRADIDEARHQHDARRDIGRAAHDAAGHGAEARRLKRFSFQPANFDGTLSYQAARPESPKSPPPGIEIGVIQPEGEQHRLLQPLMRVPFAVALLGDAERAAVEPIERRLHRVAGLALGRAVDALALVPGGVDGRLQLVVIHGFPLSPPVAEPIEKRARTWAAGRRLSMSRGNGRLARRSAFAPRNFLLASSQATRSSVTWWTWSPSAPAWAHSSSVRTSTVVMPRSWAGSRFFGRSSTMIDRLGSIQWRRTISS